MTRVQTITKRTQFLLLLSLDAHVMLEADIFFSFSAKFVGFMKPKGIQFGSPERAFLQPKRFSLRLL